MPVLPPAALADLTARAEGAMDDTCEVLRRVLAGRGPSGGLDVDYEVHAVVRCRVSPGWQPPQERSYGGGIASLVAPFVYVPLGTDVQATDRIHVTSGNEAGALWEVTGTFRRRTQEVQLTVLCSELGDEDGMSDARDLFEPDPPQAGPLGEGSPVLRELALMRLLLEAIRTEVETIRQDLAAAPPPPAPAIREDPLPPGGAAPLTAGGRASYPGFPASLRGKGW